jgi:hypothetical protein
VGERAYPKSREKNLMERRIKIKLKTNFPVEKMKCPKSWTKILTEKKRKIKIKA